MRKRFPALLAACSAVLMMAGLAVGLVLTLLFCPRADALTIARAVAWCTVATGFGGSMTVKELNLIDLLAERNHKIFWGKPGQKPGETLEIRKNSLIRTSGGQVPARSKGRVVFLLKTK